MYSVKLTDGGTPARTGEAVALEIDGRRGTPASCTTPVEPGMKLRTQSQRLAGLRRGVMEL